MRKELGTFFLLIVLCIVLAILNPSFLGAANLQNLARLIGIYGIFSLGLGFVIITGGIDLSVGSVFALLGVLLSIFLVEWHWPAALAVLAIAGIATGLGLINGLLVTKVKIQPFIVTLCGLLFYRGLARFVANDETKGFGSAEGRSVTERLRCSNGSAGSGLLAYERIYSRGRQIQQVPSDRQADQPGAFLSS